jgi:LemA protein
VDGALPAAAAALLLALAAATWSVGWLNGLNGLRRLVAEAWRQVAEELTRRQELIPQLAENVRLLAPGTAGVVDAVLAARQQALRAAAEPGERLRRRAEAEAALSVELARLFTAMREQPAMIAHPDVLALGGELRSTEDRIVAGRRHYNDAVRVLDARLRGFGPRLLARFLDLDGAEPFEVALQPPGAPSVDRAGAPSVDRAPDPTPPFSG